MHYIRWEEIRESKDNKKIALCHEKITNTRCVVVRINKTVRI